MPPMQWDPIEWLSVIIGQPMRHIEVVIRDDNTAIIRNNKTGEAFQLVATRAEIYDVPPAKK